jgi:hypothetical protein
MNRPGPGAEAVGRGRKENSPTHRAAVLLCVLCVVGIAAANAATASQLPS